MSTVWAVLAVIGQAGGVIFLITLVALVVTYRKLALKKNRGIPADLAAAFATQAATTNRVEQGRPGGGYRQEPRR